MKKEKSRTPPPRTNVLNHRPPVRVRQCVMYGNQTPAENLRHAVGARGNHAAVNAESNATSCPECPIQSRSILEGSLVLGN